MEEIRNDAKRLAYVNLFAPLALMVLSLFSLGTLATIRIDGIKWHVLFMAIVEIVIFVPYFMLWFNFLESMRKGYESNETMSTAVKFGKAALIIKIIAIIIGALASIVVVTGKSMFAGTVNVGLLGMSPNSRVDYIFSSLTMLGYVLTAVMYLLFSENTESKSSMKYLTIALTVLPVVVYSTTTRTESSYLWGIIQIGYYLIEFLFLYRIYKGYEFKS